MTLLGQRTEIYYLIQKHNVKENLIPVTVFISTH